LHFIDHVFTMNWENSSQPLGIIWNSRLLTWQLISVTSS